MITSQATKAQKLHQEWFCQTANTNKSHLLMIKNAK